MKRGFRILTLLFIIMGLTTSLAAVEKFVARIMQPGVDDIQYLQKNQYDIAGAHPGEYIDVIVTRAQYDQLNSRGFNIRIEKTEAEVKADLTY